MDRAAINALSPCPAKILSKLITIIVVMTRCKKGNFIHISVVGKLIARWGLLGVEI